LRQLSLFGGSSVRLPSPKKAKSFEGKTRAGRYLLLGGGVQSTTLARMMQTGFIEPADLVIFADTGDEPNYVYQQYLTIQDGLSSVGIKTVRSRFRPGIFIDMKRGEPQGSMPLWILNKDGSIGQLKRQCTSEYKVKVSNYTIACDLVERGEIALKYPWYWHESDGLMNQHEGSNSWIRGDSPMPRLMLSRKRYAEIIFGISTDEPRRAKADRGLLWQKAVYPLMELGMSRTDCLTWLTENGFPIPHKSACVQCPYRDDPSWLWLQQHDPASFGYACDIDDFVRSPQFNGSKRAYGGLRGDLYVHYTCTPLREVDFEGLISGRIKPQRSFWDLELIHGNCRTDGGFSCMS